MNESNFSLNKFFSLIESQFEYWMNWNNHGFYDPKIWDDNDPTTWRWDFYNTNDNSCSLENVIPLSSKQIYLDRYI